MELSFEGRGATVVSADLISRARAGDGDAFRALTEPHRRELQVHCYRMLGSLQDAEDALQDTLVVGLAGPRRVRGARVDTHLALPHRHQPLPRCAARGQPAARPRRGTVPGVEPPEPTRLGEVAWLEPFPDALLEGAIDVPLGPEARYEQTESISLAFVTALQLLPPRQLAVLILRDVLGFRASEVAEMLDSTSNRSTAPSSEPVAASSNGSAATDRETPRATRLQSEEAIWRGSYGRTRPRICLRWLNFSPTTSSCRCRRCRSSTRGVTWSASSARCCSPRAAGSAWCPPAPTPSRRSALYVRAADGTRQASGLIAVAFAGDRICSLIRFQASVFPWFGLPASLPG